MSFKIRPAPKKSTWTMSDSADKVRPPSRKGAASKSKRDARGEALYKQQGFEDADRARRLRSAARSARRGAALGAYRAEADQALQKAVNHPPGSKFISEMDEADKRHNKRLGRRD